MFSRILAKISRRDECINIGIYTISEQNYNRRNRSLSNYFSIRYLLAYSRNRNNERRSTLRIPKILQITSREYSAGWSMKKKLPNVDCGYLIFIKTKFKGHIILFLNLECVLLTLEDNNLKFSLFNYSSRYRDHVWIYHYLRY